MAHPYLALRPNRNVMVSHYVVAGSKNPLPLGMGSVNTIAFPCISTGVFHFPQDKAAKVAVKAVQEWLDAFKDTSLQKVIFNVFKDEDYHYYDQLLNKRLPYKKS